MGTEEFSLKKITASPFNSEIPASKQEGEGEGKGGDANEDANNKDTPKHLAATPDLNLEPMFSFGGDI